MIRITVTDQGKGLGTQDTSKFFERFYQGESEKEVPALDLPTRKCSLNNTMGISEHSQILKEKELPSF